MKSTFFSCASSRRYTLCIRIIFCLGIFVGNASCAGADPTPLASSEPSLDASQHYKLGRGDRVRVTVFGHEDLSGEFDVGAAGSISLPLVGDVPAQGKTAPELEQTITAKLAPDYIRNPRVGVEVLKYRPFYILGEVKSPGSYPYVNGMTVVNAVALAGGYTYRARESKIYIIREGQPGKRQQADQSTAVLPGDIIEVPERFF